MTKPDSLFWCDVETTGLDPEECDILELSFVVTSFEAPYAVREEGTFLVASRATFDILESDAQALKVCEELRVFEMHKASGLFSDIRDTALRGALVSYGNLDHRLVEMAKRLEWPTAPRTPLTDEERRTLRRRMTRIAGSSCHMDLGFLRAKLPMFARYLSYRTFDVSAAEGFLESLGYVPELGAEAPKHRAMDDLRYSMALARKLSGWISPSAMSPKEECRAVVLEVLSHGIYRVAYSEMAASHAWATVASRMKEVVAVGDVVYVEISPHERTRCRIVRKA